MNSLSKLEAVFFAALEKGPGQDRTAFLDNECSGDPDLRQRVEKMLAAQVIAGSFLESPAADRPPIWNENLGTDRTSETEAPSPPESEMPLDFLRHSEQPGHLGCVGHYEVLEIVGRGGMGIVLRAFDEKLHRVVAIKVMAPQLATSAVARKRFIREAQAAAAVSHDHVVTIHAVEEAGGLPYLAMQYVSGLSLQQRLNKSGPLELREIVRIGMQTAAGLAAAHAQGLIHRDIKPTNILLENGVERVKITDFGLARAVADASMTQTGMVAGTPQYMSPEQARGETVDRRSDLFSLGSVLYAMCTGRPPFRGDSGISVLKRVCDETPRPIRETNPDIPEWLEAIVARLHAKDPAERYQTAAEVAELLNEHLAHLQHPSVVPLPAAPVGKALRGVPSGQRNAAEGVPYRTRRLWATAAAVLLCLALGLGLAEATGTTQLTATVIRIFTPSGTLVVETDDPAVKVTIEGDGGLVITGAGAQEVRLKPGSYKVQATKDGKPVPVDRQLVTVSQGGKELVKVRLEGPAQAAAAEVQVNAFVVLGGKGVQRGKFDTLAEAVQAASDGDTIEVHGNGPFVCEPIVIPVYQALTIRAAPGYRPVLRQSPAAIEAWACLIVTSAPLTVEGLEFQKLGIPKSPVRSSSLLFSYKSPLHVANCRFVRSVASGMVVANRSPNYEIRNCEFVATQGIHGCVFWSVPPPSAKFSLERCVFVSKSVGLHLEPRIDGAVFPRGLHLRCEHNTFLTDFPFFIAIRELEKSTAEASAGGDPLIRLETAGNLFVRSRSVLLGEVPPPGPKSSPTAEWAEAFLRHALDWKGKANLYPRVPDLLRIADAEFHEIPRPRKLESLADWKQFWGSEEEESVQDSPRFQGGDVLSKALNNHEAISAPDFRLAEDSPGKRAGRDGRDLGADVDLVGPGAAYERWQKTPEYQQWLKDSGQLKDRAAAKPETGAFVLQGGVGVAERKFDTLAEAVQRASNGDIIEVRGNGPFITQPISINDRALAIRAGQGFWPIIKADPDEPGKILLESDSLLVLEGLDLQWVEAKPIDPSKPLLDCRLVVSSGPKAHLHAVNCRFLMNFHEGRFPIHCIGVWNTPLCRLQNCQLLVAGHGRLNPTFDFRGCPHATMMVDNCLTIGNAIMPQLTHAEPTKVVLNHNTLLGTNFVLLHLCNKIDPPGGEGDSRPFQIVSSANIFAGQMQFIQSSAFLEKEDFLSAKDAERLLTQLVGWQDHRNLYASPEDSALLGLSTARKSGQLTTIPPTVPITTLPAWKSFWGMEELDSQRGLAKFQGGDLVAKAKSKPELIVPEDFRLRADSAGYRAGKDGKDLGADVDLVGPGPAYERWKKTPEYQEWLKETGQLK